MEQNSQESVLESKVICVILLRECSVIALSFLS